MFDLIPSSVKIKKGGYRIDILPILLIHQIS